MLEELIIKTLLTSAVCWWFVVFEPIQNIITKLFGAKNNLFKAIMYKLLTCGLCVGFWGGLILTHNFYLACMISFLTEYMYKKTYFN